MRRWARGKAGGKEMTLRSGRGRNTVFASCAIWRLEWRSAHRSHVREFTDRGSVAHLETMVAEEVGPKVVRFGRWNAMLGVDDSVEGVDGLGEDAVCERR